jgi:hypothetical protein
LNGARARAAAAARRACHPDHIGERAPAAPAGSGQPLVVGVFEDEMRAEQAVGSG